MTGKKGKGAGENVTRWGRSEGEGGVEGRRRQVGQDTGHAGARRGGVCWYWYETTSDRLRLR